MIFALIKNLHTRYIIHGLFIRTCAPYTYTYICIGICRYMHIHRITHTCGPTHAHSQFGLMGSLDVFVDFTSSAWKANWFVWLSSRLERTEMEG